MEKTKSPIKENLDPMSQLHPTAMAVNKIQESFGGYLMNFIKSKIACAEDAKDIYQDIIVKIINKSNSLAKEESFESWVFAIARNQIIDYYRSRKKMKELISAPEISFERKEEKAYSEMESCVHGFINLLPEEYKDLIVKSEIDGKSQKQLSEITGIKYVTLRSKVQRGRERIQKMLLNSCKIEKDSAGGVLECAPTSNKSSFNSSTCGCDN